MRLIGPLVLWACSRACVFVGTTSQAHTASLCLWTLPNGLYCIETSSASPVVLLITALFLSLSISIRATRDRRRTTRSVCLLSRVAKSPERTICATALLAYRQSWRKNDAAACFCLLRSRSHRSGSGFFFLFIQIYSDIYTAQHSSDTYWTRLYAIHFKCIIWFVCIWQRDRVRQTIWMLCVLCTLAVRLQFCAVLCRKQSHSQCVYRNSNDSGWRSNSSVPMCVCVPSVPQSIR